MRTTAKMRLQRLFIFHQWIFEGTAVFLSQFKISTTWSELEAADITRALIGLFENSIQAWRTLKHQARQNCNSFGKKLPVTLLVNKGEKFTVYKALIDFPLKWSFRELYYLVKAAFTS